MGDYLERFETLLSTRIDNPTFEECVSLREGRRVIQVLGPGNRYYLYDKRGCFLFDLQTDVNVSNENYQEIEEW